MSTIQDVRRFWESSPLWTGESSFAPGSREFFEEHRNIVIQDCLGGQFDERLLPPERNRIDVLDLGCGPGFWTVELALRGCRRIVAADLTEKSLALARLRCEQYGVCVQFAQQDAENLGFPSEAFSHVNCQGVIHHTPNSDASVREIARVLRAGGTASISVYYHNFFLRHWGWLNWTGWLISKLGGRLSGRGREGIFAVRDSAEIVRLYDGKNNPIGKSYSSEQFTQMLAPWFRVQEVFFHFFPARALPFRVPKSLHRWLDGHLGFMIFANCTKL